MTAFDSRGDVGLPNMEREFEFHKLILFSHFYLIYFKFRGFHRNHTILKYDFLHSYLGIFPNRLNFVENLFENSGNVKMWDKIKKDFHLSESKKIQWMKLINASCANWKKSIKEEQANLII